MYYVLGAIFLIIVYFALTKLLSSIVKGCLVTLGVALLISASYFFLKSAKEPVVFLNRVLIDNFQVKVLPK